MIPDEVLTGKMHVEFLEFIREMGRECFSDDEGYGRYCKTVELLGEDCRMTRQVAKDLVEKKHLQKYLKKLEEYLEWMSLPS